MTDMFQYQNYDRPHKLADGSEYEGELFNEIPHGYGNKKNANKGFQYQG